MAGNSQQDCSSAPTMRVGQGPCSAQGHWGLTHWMTLTWRPTSGAWGEKGGKPRNGEGARRGRQYGNALAGTATLASDAENF